MRFPKVAALVVAALLPFATPITSAQASTVVFDWTLTGPAASLGGVPLPGSGTITAITGTGGEVVTAITGTIGGVAITGLTTFNGSDDLIFPSGTTFVDTKGLTFTTATGQQIDIFSFFAEGSPPSGNAYGEIASPGGFGVGTFDLTAQTPLPAALPLYAAGLGVVGFVARRKKRRSDVPA